MSKRFFTSLLLGFGITLAILVAISMPPGGWGVAVGVALGLLAALPLFLIVMTLIKRPLSEAQYAYQEPQAVPPVVIIQQQLPQGVAMPLPPQAQHYGYAYAPEAYTDSLQDYLVGAPEENYYQSNYEPYPEMLSDPRLYQRPSYQARPYEYQRRSRPLRSHQRFVEPVYDEAIYPENVYLPSDNIQAQYQAWDGQGNDELYDYYDQSVAMGEAIAPPDLHYYEEQQLRRRRDAHLYQVRSSQGQEYTPPYNNAEADADQIVEAEYREINVFGEED